MKQGNLLRCDVKRDISVINKLAVLYKALDGLEGCHLFVAGEDTEHQGDKGQQGQAQPKVGHVVLPLGLGYSVGQR